MAIQISSPTVQPQPTENYYVELGVAQAADTDDIKRSYYKLMRLYNTDTGSDPDRMMEKRINAAYAVLSKPEQRRLYDQSLLVPEVDDAAALTDFMSRDPYGLRGLGGMAAVTAAAGRDAVSLPGRLYGEDLITRLTVSFLEAAFGVTTSVLVNRLVPCRHCTASGQEPGYPPQPCPTCGGEKQVTIRCERVFQPVVERETCSTCAGEGYLVTNPCTLCRGEGRVRAFDWVAVTVPDGCVDRQVLIVAGEGSAGVRGAVAAQLKVIVHVSRHAYFWREGLDVLVVLPLDIGEAVLGAEVDVPLPRGGYTKVSVASGTQPGDELTVASAGIPHQGGSGSLRVRVTVIIPPALSEAEQEQWRTAKDALGIRQIARPWPGASLPLRPRLESGFRTLLHGIGNFVRSFIPGGNPDETA